MGCGRLGQTMGLLHLSSKLASSLIGYLTTFAFL
jgi:hypothetical protein